MNDLILNDLDKLLLKLVFQLEQASYAKEYERQQIQIYSANIVEMKGEICQLQEDIHKNDEVIVSLQKQHNNNKENCSTWKPSYMILSQHEEYLQKELQNYQETTEKDKKMYQDYMHQYQETLKQHQAKYAQTAIAQEYYREKKECEEIQSRILKQSELFQQKEALLKDIQDPGQFQSLSSWALQIASLRQNTKETLKHAVDLRQQSLQLDKITEDLQRKMNYTKQQLEKMTDDPKHPKDQNLHDVAVEKNEKNLEASLFIKSPKLLTVKQQACIPLHLPGITQKVVKTIPTLKTLFQQRETETGVQEKENPAGNSTITSMYFNHMESNKQKCSDIEGTNIAKTVQASSITSFQNQTPFRLLSYQKKLDSKQWFENEATETEKNTDWTGMEGENKSKDSTYVSQASRKIRSSFSDQSMATRVCQLGATSLLPSVQDGLGKGCINSTGHPSTESQESAENFPRTPEPSRVSNTLNTPREETSFDLLQSESEGSTHKSPGFSFLTGFTGKSSGFNFFDSSAFGNEILPDHQTGESCSAEHINPASPCKNIGDLFGKMDSEDSFAFSFPPCSSAQAFQDGKDDFSFPFVFESSEPSSLKGFQSSSQSKKPFSFF